MDNLNLKLTKNTPIANNQKKIFYLGAWCLADEVNFSHDKYLIHKYHWDDREKLHDDYKGLIDHLEFNFNNFSKYMNKVIGVEKTETFWKINLGTWLGYLIQILFDRWENIRTLPNFKFNLIKAQSNITNLRSNSVRDFFVDFRTDDWNEIVYQSIIHAQGKDISIDTIKSNANDNVSINEDKKTISKKITSNYRLKLWRFYTSLLHKIKNPNFFIISHYLSYINQLKLNLFLKQIPFEYKKFIFDPKIDYKSEIKNKKNFNHKINLNIDQKSNWSKKNEDFLRWFHQVVPYLVPYNYYFNFKKFFRDMKNLPFPQKPKIIFTSVLHIQHDYFNLYSSENINFGSKLIIGQHGGTFRSSKINFIDYVQNNISNYYITWGKDERKDGGSFSKILPVGNLKISSKKLYKKSSKKNKRILLLTIETQRHSEFLSSIPISSQWLKYFEDVKKFLEKIDEIRLLHNVVIRNKTRKFAWNFQKKILFYYPNLKFDSITDYYKSIYSSSLVVSTYNGATYLETMSLNIPSIIFWDPNYSELIDSSVAHYNELCEVGIFHKSPESAAEFIREIDCNINKWWFSDKVQNVRKNFCDRYSRKEIDISQKISKIFKNA